MGALPSEHLERRQAAEIFYRILDARPTSTGTCSSFELEDMSTHQIADLLGMRRVTVRVWLFRARSAFLKQQKRLARRETSA